MTAVAAARLPKRRMVLLVVVALAVSAVAASATAVALGSRADLSSSRRRVDVAWAALRPALDARYQSLGQAAGVARARLDADRTVFDDIDKAVTEWPGTERWPTDRQVAAAAHLEGLAARLAATVATTPRLRGAADVTAALGPVRRHRHRPGRGALQRRRAALPAARGGFPRSAGGRGPRLRGPPHPGGSRMKLLVVGGAGYIGSVVAAQLIDAGPHGDGGRQPLQGPRLGRAPKATLRAGRRHSTPRR